ncbi:MAG: hypothetical protein U1F65_02880 [Verrucomicrobiota bacterium]
MKKFILFAGFVSLATVAFAQGTAFTYQGRLNDGANPASGSYDLRFALFDAASNGTQQGNPLTNSATAISNGLFSVSLDFGNQFAGANRWVEIAVRTNGAASFFLLAPRQALTPAPYAIYAASAGSGGGSPWLVNGNDTYYNSGRVGIGTASPTHYLHIAAGGPAIALQDTNASSQQAGYVSYRDNGNIERAWIGYGTAGSPDFSIVNARTSGDIVLLPFSGNVGINTATPAAMLDVRGDIRLGASGEFFPVKSLQNDRTLRGTVGGTGIIAVGSGAGFTITQTATGRYTINFNQAFAAAPTVVVTSLSAARQVNLNTTLNTAVGIQVTDLSGVDANGGFTFIVMGQ